MAAHRASFSRLEQATTRLVEELVPLWSSGRDETDPLDYVEVIRDREVLIERNGEAAGVALDRKVLADIAVKDAAVFTSLVATAKAAAPPQAKKKAS